MTTPSTHPPITKFPQGLDSSRVKAIACDMDGTTLLPTHTPSPRTISTFSVLRKRHPDIHILFATGRPRSAAGNISPLLATVHRPVGVYLNGALAGEEVPDVDGGTDLEVLYERPVKCADARWYLDWGLKRGYTVIVYSGDEILTTVTKDPVFDFMKESGEPTVLVQRDVQEFVNGVAEGVVKAHKLAFVSMDHQKVDRIRSELDSDTLRPTSTTMLVRTGPERLEVMHTDATKAHALAVLCETGKLGEEVGLDAVLAFGDGENDVEMLREVGMGVAMGNAVQRAKDVAGFVCPPNDEDGVARVLEGLFRLSE
ncbi:cof-like hydrolase [Spizellomyces punctatus DAOM BR117]|uniref:Cof-like hydrolase n=1 Tax=Spizellomyces punctatus (strain DAOM BR117) TaxID=645134 RepID=A0A0L0HBT1_SPIPD|nr:cof-like hydrolase [Spizellomyces punctatus DAOM BR117]KNC99040.1 cof-like hydrolase [Spizellomyces punctatus DAOM BR117]|eukprot:XP_016607080.1 cof-like hydrolase [Spizellomyces punctatus DAOM BR117]